MQTKSNFIFFKFARMDEPTGFYIEVFTKEEKIKQITEEYQKELNKIEALFK